MLPFYNGMNELRIPIDKAGRVVLPKHVRDELAIKPGDQLKISIHGNVVTLRPTNDESGFIKRGRALVFSCEGADLLDNETVETIRAAERGSLLGRMAKGLSSPARQ
jgi:AbrB family looped-hinge helix DNA binding protein